MSNPLIDFRITREPIYGNDYVVSACNAPATEYLVSLGREDDVDDVTVVDEDAIIEFIRRIEMHGFIVDEVF